MSNPAERRVRLLYFAWVREKVGRAGEDVELPSGVQTVAELVAWLKTRGPEFGDAFARPEVVRAALDKPFDKPLIQTRHGIGYRMADPDAASS